MELFTIGYEGETIGGFIQRLVRYGIDVVADVRLNPISRKPAFSKGPLTLQLANCSIEYVHFKELGTPQNLRSDLKDTGDYRKFAAEYRKYAVTRTEILDKLHCLIKSRRVALMCLERFPEKCHRSVLALMLKEIDGNGLRILSA